MASFFSQLNEEKKAFIAEQKMFFVATAPTNDGRVNVSTERV